MPLYVGVSIRVPVALAEYTSFLNEVTVKRANAVGAEGEAYQKILDILGGSILTLTGGYSLITEYLSSLTSMSDKVQENINQLLKNPDGWFTAQTIFEQPTTVSNELTSEASVTE